MATSMAFSGGGILTKNSSDPRRDYVRDPSPAEKEQKPPTRANTQPEGTFAYTVDKDDTLTSIAARFETTPSELVKINRLASRFVCPGKVLFIPEKISEDAVKSCDKSPSPHETVHEHSKPSSPSSPTLVQESPKPGHAERIKGLTTPPHHSTRILSKEEERRLDQDCIERFLKIYGVRHITDGQGVVGGVLLVTPNAAIFEPDVMETLVSERGIDKYYVNAPFDYVASAALYNDIVHMRVRHAPIQASNLPAPIVYYPKQSPPYKSHASQGSEVDSSDQVLGLPKRSESQQAVKGSVSDKADLELSEEGDSEDCRSVGSYHSDNGDSNDGKSESSDVFAEDRPELSGCKKDVYLAAVGVQTDQLLNGCEVVALQLQQLETDQTVHKKNITEEVSPTRLSCNDTNKELRSGDTSSPNMLQEPFEKAGNQLAEDSVKCHPSSAALLVPNGRLSEIEETCSKSDGGSDVSKKWSPSGLNFLSSLPDVIWPVSSSAPTTKEEAAELENSVNKKLFTPEHLVTDKSKLKMLKKFPYPRWNSDALISGAMSSNTEERDTPQVKPSEEKKFTTKDGISKVQQQASSPPSHPNAFSRLLANATPQNFVDFSSGLFQTSGSENVGKVEDISQFQRQVSYSLPSPILHGFLPSGGKNFFEERRGSSPESIVLETVNLHASLGRRFSEDSNIEKNRIHPGSKDDIRIEFKSEITLEDKKELFQNIDEIVPVPAKPCEDPPLYLCLIMGRVAQTKSLFSSGTKQPKKTKREYWFSIPKDRVDELYHFIEHWAPGAYGSEDVVDYKSRGLELISADELSDEDIETVQLRTADTTSMSSSLGAVVARRAPSESLPDWEDVPEQDNEMSLELELPLPELIGETEILTEELRRTIFKILPARAEGYSWSLIFSASQHGFSLQSMYRWMAKFETPVLLVIQDTENHVFGAMTSCTLKVSDHFYGTGESFLFSFYPEFKTFKWTGENAFFIKGNPESLAIGAGDGVFGLWLDGDLYHGRSHPCKTYNNATLSSREDFCVKLLEAWGFIEFGDSAQRDSLC